MIKIMEPEPETEKEKWRLHEALFNRSTQRRDLHTCQHDDERYGCVNYQLTDLFFWYANLLNQGYN